MSATDWVLLISILAGFMPAATLSQVSDQRQPTRRVAGSAPDIRQPYMAEFKIVQTRKLVDGNTVTTRTTEVSAVDSEGRRLTALTKAPTDSGQMSVTEYTVIDPINHSTMRWNSPGTVATVSAIPIPTAAQCSGGAGVAVLEGFGTEKQRPITKTIREDLGKKTLLGIEVRGFRTTITKSSVDSAVQPQVIILEKWAAVDPVLRGLVTQELNDDSRSGRTIRELVKFRRVAPNRSLFQIPRGYEIVNREVAMDNCASAEEMGPTISPAK